MLDLAGQKFGRLTVIEYTDRRIYGSIIWRCKCDCGKEIFVGGKYLRRWRTKSCGCLMKEGNNYKHGYKGSPTYNSWVNMKNRCHYPSHISFKYYGGRGIKVCGRWENSFKNFLKDMGERPKNMTLDRVDNNKGYKPNNCRWVSQKEQVYNRRNSVRPLPKKDSKDFKEFWKRKNESDEQRRLRDIRLPFKKKIPIIEELMEQAIFFLDLQEKRRGKHVS